MRTRHFRFGARAGGKPPGLLGQLLMLVFGTVLAAVVFLFSLLLFAGLAVAGLALWGYLRWKTAGVRGQAAPATRRGGIVIDGEVVRAGDDSPGEPPRDTPAGAQAAANPPPRLR